LYDFPQDCPLGWLVRSLEAVKILKAARQFASCKFLTHHVRAIHAMKLIEKGWCEGFAFHDGACLGLIIKL
jgi:hypothetical protein